MAGTALTTLPRRLINLPSFLRSKPLSTSPSPSDLRELLRIHRILPNPNLQPQEHASLRTKPHFLHRAGLHADDVAALSRRFPGLLETCPGSRLDRLFQELGDLGFSKNDVRAALQGDPRTVLSMEAGEMSRCVELLDGLRCRRPVKERILARGVPAAAVAVKQRVDCLHARGLTRRDAFKVLFVEPRVLLYSIEDVERKMEFLVGPMGFSVQCIVEYPEFLGMNLEKQIVPRLNVVEHLRSIGGLGDPVEMKHFVRLSRRRFYNLFVKPYPECERIFGGVVRESESRPRHPAGLWKMFRPRKYPVTEEDTKNMKLFMQSLC